MNIGKRTAVIVATILVLAACSFLGLEGCGGGDDGRTCSPPPHFTSAPGTTAVVGQQYFYEVHAFHLCDSFLPFPCSDWHAIQLPPGARVDGRFILWTPTPSQANRNFRFKIETERDWCGKTAIQEWTVHVRPVAAFSTSAVGGLSGTAVASTDSGASSTGTPPDTNAPSVPTELSARRISASEVDLAWNGSSDNVAVAGYKLYRDGMYVKSVTGSGLWTGDAGLDFNTQYSYSISAYDFAGNESAQSASIGIRTLEFLPGNVVHWGLSYKGSPGIDWARAIPDVEMDCRVSCKSLGSGSAISQGGGQSLAVQLDGSVLRWWYGSSPDFLLRNVTAVGAGDAHGLAIQSDGTVWGWGSNWDGQLGDGTTNDTRTPIQMLNVSQAAAVAGGFSHSLILKSDGAVWATGGNSLGQLGDGTTNGHTTVIQVPTLSSIIAIAASADQSLALKSDGTVWAWGGTDSSSYHSTPTLVAGISNVIAISQGRGFALAAKADGTVWAWGSNSDGQLGDGTNTDQTVPVQVMGLTNVMTVAAGYDHALALRTDGTVWAWGSNSDGQLGDGTTISKNVPVQVLRLAQVKAIAAGWRQSLALR